MQKAIKMKSNNFETIVTVGLSPFMTPVVVRITTPWMRFQQLKKQLAA